MAQTAIKISDEDNDVSRAGSKASRLKMNA